MDKDRVGTVACCAVRIVDVKAVAVTDKRYLQVHGWVAAKKPQFIDCQAVALIPSGTGTQVVPYSGTVYRRRGKHGVDVVVDIDITNAVAGPYFVRLSSYNPTGFAVQKKITVNNTVTIGH